MRSAFAKARSLLEAQTEAARKGADPRLPSVADMARSAGVSVVTMQKAVHAFSAQGEITATPGQGIHVNHEPVPHRTARPVPPPATISHHKWHRTAEGIQSDILKGTFARGTLLPHSRELAARYGVSYKTLRKALRFLAEQQVLSSDMSRFRVPAWGSEKAGSCIILIVRGLPWGPMFPLSPRTVSNLRVLENQCARNRVALKIATVNDEGIRLLSASGREMSIGEAVQTLPVLGFVVWTMGLSAYDPSSIIRSLYRHRAPVAVFDEGDNITVPAPSSSRTKVKHFLLGTSRAAGRSVARHLLGLGHMHIAFISPYHDADYSHRRLEGLYMEYRACGQTRSITECVSAERLPDGACGRWHKSKEAFADFLCDQGWFGHSHGEPLSEKTLLRATRQLRDIAHNQDLRDVLYPLLQQAMSLQKATAWVLINDQCAIEAVDYCASRGRNVPRDISIVSFDNSTEATLEGITSYNFNTGAYMHAMMNHLFNPTYLPWNPRTDPPIEIDGFVTVRGSTGRA